MRTRTIDTTVEALPTRPRTVEPQRVKLPVFNGRRHIVILGRGKFAKTCWDMLAEDPKMARRVIGFVQGAGDQAMEQFDGPGVVGGFEELPELVERYQIGMIAVCLDDHRAALPVKTLLDLKVAGIEVIDGHRLFEQLTGRLSIDSLRPSALIFSAGFNRRAMTMLLKRTVDVVVAAVSLVLTAPLLLLVACLIKLDSPGPVFYRQLRVGLKANPFMIVKFRSMVQDAESQGPRWAQDGDPRVSRVGRWLRKWRIDEFPQFINVLKGEMNELSLIFHRLGIDTKSVLDAAGTKWNFLRFSPGLVGGHCIGVDPYYLTSKAESVGYHPQVILAGRRINNGMGKFVAEQTMKLLSQTGRPVKDLKVAVLGLTFKENVPDLRNSKVPDIIAELREYGVQVIVHDAIAESGEAEHEYGIKLVDWPALQGVDGVIVAVAHRAYLDKGPGEIMKLLGNPQQGVLVDVKSMFDPAQVPAGIKYWRL